MLVGGLIFLLAGDLISGDDQNPFRMPVPVDPDNPGSIILHGGGRVSEKVRSEFVQLAGGPEARIVIIPSGTYVRGQRDDGTEFDESPQQFEERVIPNWQEWFALQDDQKVRSVKLLYTDNQTDCDDQEFVDILRSATGVLVPAAYQGKLAWRFTHRYPDKWENHTDSLFQTELRRVVARGGVVMGHGGGATALTELMIMGNEAAEADPMRAHVQPGLGLFSGAIVEQNFDAIGGRLERFAELLKDSKRINALARWPANGKNMIGLALERGAAAVISGNSMRVIGPKDAHVFLKSNGDRTIQWRTISEEDKKIEIVTSQRIGATAKSASGTSDGASQANPFGMPLPNDPTKPGMVVLHGGGNNFDLIELFPKLTGHRQPDIVHCPAADSEFQPQENEPEAKLHERIREYFDVWDLMGDDGRAASVHFATCSDPRDARTEDFLRPIRRAEGVWFSGGDQSELSRLFVEDEDGHTSESHFVQELYAVVSRGGVVGGSSAGTAIMAEVMTVSTSSSEDGVVRANTGRGFGVLSNVIVEQHLGGEGRGGRFERFISVLRDNSQMEQYLPKGQAKKIIGIAIEEETYALLQENRMQILGADSVHVFLKSLDQHSIVWHELVSGDEAFIVPTATGPQLYLNEWNVR
jgi:cyanophycinase